MQCNKYITNILKAYVKDEKNDAKNSTTFFNYIRNISIEEDEIMVSFDVSSAYTSISLTDALIQIKHYANDDQSVH